MFGRNLNDKLPALNPTSPKAIDFASISKRDAMKKGQSKQYHNNKNKVALPNLKVGDTVVIHNEKKSKTKSTLAEDSIQSHCSQRGFSNRGRGESTSNA